MSMLTHKHLLVTSASALGRRGDDLPFNLCTCNLKSLISCKRCVDGTPKSIQLLLSNSHYAVGDSGYEKLILVLEGNRISRQPTEHL